MALKAKDVKQTGTVKVFSPVTTLTSVSFDSSSFITFEVMDQHAHLD